LGGALMTLDATEENQ